MKRRDFFKKGTKGVLAAGLIPVVNACDITRGVTEVKGSNTDDKTSTKKDIKRRKTLSYDVAVLGGGLAGMCAAVSAARNGAKTVIIQDRPVLGGNASSEMRVHVNGVTHLKPNGLPERETGVIEEILLHNRFRNPQEAYPVFDHVMYDYIVKQDNLDLMLNTQANEAIMDGNTIVSAICWQLTTETEFTINAKQFIDCSGDGMMAASAGADFRTGREASAEFDEKYAPKEADGWQMGATLLMSSKDMGKPMPYEAPSYVIKYDYENAHPKRKIKGFEGGIWWVEVGSKGDIIAEQEENRERLMGHLHGVWDYIKNSGKFPEADNYALDWVQSIPGRRESRRFVGDFILSEKDLTEHRHFEDAVAYGGWSLDEHNWGGIENITHPPSYFHAYFDKVYEIPYRSLYSKNIANLLFAGRNISQTHIALSSSRVMGTCALMGQAVGTAASICVKKNVTPRKVAEEYINELQEQLLRDDAFIPNRPANDANDLAQKATVLFGSTTKTGDAKKLTNGISRDFNGEINHWQSESLPANIQMEWETPVQLSAVELKCDTNVKKNIMMRKDSKNNETFANHVPVELLKKLDLEVRVEGEWKIMEEILNNRTRLIKFNFESTKVSAIRVNMSETYGAETAKLFEIRCYA
ncbi:FAD-dependent oxidoreductase [Flavicella sp.]|uniref:FAD-dependent oxidoreductase n=1 Tax=Flavicella sp. TaxID=2957742 RepID=UPI00260DAC4D|nr:FAD-dependent oxidoreductase [Flavicella sp.]MDG1803549.1 FAD-dependent oxidoreductase [Flavicella sp.]